jgi:hypothetical protein
MNQAVVLRLAGGPGGWSSAGRGAADMTWTSTTGRRDGAVVARLVFNPAARCHACSPGLRPHRGPTPSAFGMVAGAALPAIGEGS